MIVYVRVFERVTLAQNSHPPTDSNPLPRPRLRQHGWARFWRDFIEMIVVVATIYSLVNLATARFVVEGDSMQSTFETGQYLIVSRAHYLLNRPQRGDIVVFHYPVDPSTDFIKRVIGLPGEIIEIHDGDVYINDVLLDEPYLDEACLPRNCENDYWELGINEYFVMGDNRNRSQDSRAFGPVDRSYLIGTALVRYWPPRDWGVVSRAGFTVAANPK